MDHWPWGLLALAAIVFGGVSILAVPPLGLLGIASLVYLGYLYVADHDEADDGDDPP